MKQSKHSKTYEITLPGFDGSIDATDHLVIWIGSDTPEEVILLARAHNAQYYGEVAGNVDCLVDYDLPKDWEELKEYIAKHSITN